MPQENEAMIPAFYDHEIDDQPRSTSGRRRRPAADWGVGEDIFDRMPSPSRRFSHRRDEEWNRPSAAESTRDERTEQNEHRFARRPPRERHVETWDDDAIAAWGGEDEPREEGSRTIVIGTSADPSEEDAPQIATDGRRTIVISGHPDRLPAPRVQRPARTAVERIGARPDRIVGYTVALGFLLILIAILTT